MERDITIERIKEDMKKAFLYGTRSGNPCVRSKKTQPNNFKKYYEKWTLSKITALEFAKLLEIRECNFLGVKLT